MRVARVSGAVLSVVLATFLVVFTVHASPQGQLSQQVNAGTLTTDIRDASYATVASPSFAMSTLNISNDCQTSTGTYGSSSQRIYVDNPGGANNGWTLTINATTPGTETWSNGTDTYKYNDATTGGCANGQLTLDPSVATLTMDAGSNTAITKGTSTGFTSTTPITLLTAASGSDDILRGYLTGVGVSQKVPASKPGGSYTLDLTQTVTAS